MTHDEKICRIIEEIKKRASSKEPIVFAKKSVSHLVPNPRGKKVEKERIDIGDLNEILEIDEKNRICTAESGVTFYDLTSRTLPLGLMPYTVPELKGITVGGAVSGCSIESESYRYGGFHDSCLEYELITTNGDVLTCSPQNNADVFQMVHGSYGTLGLLSKLKFKLCPAKPYVKMTYAKFARFDEFWKFLQERCMAGDYEFVDAIIHNKNLLVACLGNMVDSAPYTSSYGVDIFYKSTRGKNEDYMKASDYFFRYDADCHWLAKTIPILESKLVRKFFGRLFLGSTSMIRWSKRLEGLFSRLNRRPDVIVDVFIPSKRFPEFYAWYEKNFDFYPLWIVPYRMPQMYPWVNPAHAAKSGETFFIDCAIYGKKNNDPHIDYSELLEDKVFEMGGVKTLISRNHYDEKRFWEIYNCGAYETVKQKTDPQNLLGTVYQNRVEKQR